MRGTATSRALVGLLLVLGATACSPTPQPVQGQGQALPVAVTPSPVSGPNDAQEIPQPAPAEATWDDSSAAAAVDLAQRAMTAFARPATDAEAWFTGLAPLLTPNARSAYVGTDPAEVPARAVTGPGRAEAAPSAYLAFVTVPTDVGDYRLLLSRESGDAGWLVETITAPDGVR